MLNLKAALVGGFVLPMLWLGIGFRTGDCTSTIQPPVLTSPFVGPLNCTSCPGCIGGHTGVISDGDYQPVHQWCMEQVGCPHPGCTGALINLPLRDSLETRELIYAALGGDTKAMSTLLTEAPNKFRLNVRRNAFQIVGCREDVIVGHIPLNLIQLGQLKATQSREFAAR